MCCLVKAWQFHPGGSSLTSPPHFLYSFSVHEVGVKWGSPAIIKEHNNCFPGPFRIPSKPFFYLSPPCIFALHISKYPCTKNQSVT